ncbi:MAG: MltA domain-containing protein [Deltaproteobacteria bacterium]|nr:MltA domain-containing protein [Candidatus Anaeroferrophillacea bacterium]
MKWVLFVVVPAIVAVAVILLWRRPLPPPAISAPPALNPCRVAPELSGDDGPVEEPAAAALCRALLEAAEYLRRRGGDEAIAMVGERVIGAAELEAFQRRLASRLAAGMEVPALLAGLAAEGTLCRPAAAAGADKVVRLTGYYHPRVAGSFTPSETCAWPLYRRPADLVTVDLGAFAAAGVREGAAAPPRGLAARFRAWWRRWGGADHPPPREITGRLAGGRLLPFPDRAAIDGEGALAGRGLELLWLADPVERFFLHVQGSGEISLPDGRVVAVAYDGNNGHPYASIGTWLLENGHLPSGGASLPGIRDFLATHPERRDRVLAQNPRYVFFRIDAATGGAPGSGGMRLVAGRGIAVDPAVYPLGALAWLETELPVFTTAGRQTGWRQVSRLVVTQDTGGAIRGPGRADFFFGSGPAAARAAGIMDRPARLTIILPSPSTAR